MREEKFQCQVFLNGNLNSLGTQGKKQKSQRTNLFSSGALSDEDSDIEKKGLSIFLFCQNFLDTNVPQLRRKQLRLKMYDVRRKCEADFRQRVKNSFGNKWKIVKEMTK